MSQKLSIKNNIKFYILSFIIISVCTFLFTFNPSTTKAYAAAVDQALDAGGLALVSNDVETYTVNFYNGTEGIGAFNISPGDQYILAQTGYSINGNYWYNDLIYMEMSYVVVGNDINDPNNEFYWHYQDPFENKG